MDSKSIIVLKILFSVILVLFSGCGDTEEPEISELQWQLNWLYNTKNQKISNFFTMDVELSVDNPRYLGIDLTLHMEQAKLLWKLRRINYDSSQAKKPKYSGNFMFLNHQLLPQGEYEIHLESSNQFRLDNKKIILEYQHPEISDFPTVNEDSISPNNDQPIIIFIYRNGQFFMMTYALPYQKISKRTQGNFFYLYTYNPRLQAGLISGPY